MTYATPEAPSSPATTGRGSSGPSRRGYYRVQPARGWVGPQFREVWQYRELLFFLVWRDVKVRYTQTVLGIAWAVIQPLFTMVVLSIFFGGLAKVPSDGLPYPLFSFVALVPWTYFAQSLSQSSNSLVGSANLLSKVYFPRLIIPLSGVLVGLVDFAIAMLILLGMLVYYRIPITPTILLLPGFLLLALVTALGVGLWLSALNVEYRDVRYVVPFLVQLWMFATPVAYPSSLLNEPWRTLDALNPMVGVVEGFRWALVGNAPPSSMVLVSAMAACVVLATGTFYFRRMESSFADVV